MVLLVITFEMSFRASNLDSTDIEVQQAPQFLRKSVGFGVGSAGGNRGWARCVPWALGVYRRGGTLGNQGLTGSNGRSRSARNNNTRANSLNVREAPSTVSLRNVTVSSVRCRST